MERMQHACRTVSEALSRNSASTHWSLFFPIVKVVGLVKYQAPFLLSQRSQILLRLPLFTHKISGEADLQHVSPGWFMIILNQLE